MHFNLRRFKDNLFRSAHLQTMSNSLLQTRTHSLIWLTEQLTYSWTSLVNMCMSHIGRIFGKSLTYRLNQRGPGMDPCETPRFTDRIDDLEACVATSCDR